MSVHEARGTLAKAYKELMLRWAEVRANWDDAQAKAFEETRLKTHVTKLRPLLADRTAWNKVFRRSFWDKHGFRFPEGRTYEDTPITIPAHFLARSVDVIADPVYYWRIRDSGGLSITQRKFEPQAATESLSQWYRRAMFVWLLIPCWTTDHSPAAVKKKT